MCVTFGSTLIMALSPPLDVDSASTANPMLQMHRSLDSSTVAAAIEGKGKIPSLILRETTTTEPFL